MENQKLTNLLEEEYQILEKALKAVNKMFDKSKLEKDCDNSHQACNSFKCFCSLKKCKKEHMTIDVDFFFNNLFLKQNPKADNFTKEIYRNAFKKKMKEIENGKNND